jgi:RNA polymerase sigma factor (sigma-70 family)
MRSDQEILRGIASHDSGTLNYIYDELYPYVEAYVVHNGGSEDNARDIFQDAMIIVYKKIMAENLVLNCKFSTYLYAVSKNLWIQNRKKHFSRINILKEMPAVAESETNYEKVVDDESKELFDKHFSRLGPDCQKILLLYFNGATMEEIRKEMGISTLHLVSDKKYRCKKNLFERIKGDPNYRKPNNE